MTYAVDVLLTILSQHFNLVSSFSPVHVRSHRFFTTAAALPVFLCTFLPSFSHPTHFSAAVSSNSLCCSSSSFRSHTAADATADADSTNCRKHGQ